MNKTTKGSLAALAAAALLLGGGGSLAYWQATEDVDGGTITAGQLALDAAACDTAGWTVTNAVEGVTGAPFDVAAEDVVPGDVLTKTCSVAITAEGTNLRADLDVTAAAVGDAAPAMDPSDYTVTGTFLVGGEQVTEITDADDGSTIDATIVVSVPVGTTVDNGSQGTVIDLEAFTITATQVSA
ncbi:alternate-type signal peptide domain-containing protein [Auraticoccus sp. F435]|uniref:Alternate-type signal peptide domain-containing protein n=1 Tax=Auraticoccus cholistanensis TaxID=2656650 RepID=A0A6A9UU36_9ACTN|nr:alternate-type signal peptide domain-containing protein [Auraticoccus cholistanensis]MVA74717.1 alternate-type signal peptide domain-containing protein [Auraticoccus cholistanensis]